MLGSILCFPFLGYVLLLASLLVRHLLRISCDLAVVDFHAPVGVPIMLAYSSLCILNACTIVRSTMISVLYLRKTCIIRHVKTYVRNQADGQSRPTLFVNLAHFHIFSMH